MNWRSWICRARLFGMPIVGHDDGCPVYVSRGLRSFGWKTDTYTCRRCGTVRTFRYMS